MISAENLLMKVIMIGLMQDSLREIFAEQQVVFIDVSFVSSLIFRSFISPVTNP